MPDQQNILVINRKPPIGSVSAQESVDTLLTLGAFGQRMSVLFIGDGVFQLLNDQQPNVLAIKSTASMLKALDVYDINRVYVEADALQQRGLTTDDLCMACQTLARVDIHTLIDSHDTVLNY